MDFELSKRQIELREEVRQFVHEHCTRQRAREAEHAKEFREELWGRIVEKEWTGLTIPKEYGGKEESFVELLIIFEELSKGFFEANARLMTDLVFANHLIGTYGNEEQKRKFLPLIVHGNIHFGLGFTEPSGGTDLLSLLTTAFPDNGGYILKGTKMFCTLAHKADYLIILAITDKESRVIKKTKGLSLFLVPTNSEGLTIRRIETVGWGTIGTTEVHMEDVRVGREALIGETNMAWGYLAESLNYERVGFAAMMVGIAGMMLDDVIQYVKNKKVANKVLGQSQIVQQIIGQIAIDIESSRMLVYKGGHMIAREERADVISAMALSCAARVARDACVGGMNIVGEDLFCEELNIYDLMRHYMIVKPLAVVPFANEMRLMHIAESLGLGRSY